MEKIGIEYFDEIYRLMQLSFIKDELRTYEQQRSLFDEPIFHVYGELDNSKHLKGFIAIWEFTHFVFVDYLAVHPSYRNQGLGKILLEELANRYSCPICLEIETPVDELTTRRQHFYERNHFKLCPFRYQQPPISRGNALVSLSLMSTKENLGFEEFKEIKEKIYDFAYKRFL